METSSWVETSLKWSITLTEPLLHPSERNRRVDAMELLTQEHPDWARIVFAGAISNIAATLPSDDPWRDVSARLGDVAVGTRHLESNGSTWPSGNRFGTADDFYDISPVTFGSVGEDPQLAAVELPISDISAALAVISFSGWRTAAKSIRTAQISQDALYGECYDALRWVIMRRRGYGLPPDDDWIWQSCFAWAIRAGSIVNGDGLDEDEITAEIAIERIPNRDNHSGIKRGSRLQE